MRALIEYLELLRGTVALWWRFFPILGFWFLTGWALREFAIQATVVLGAKNPIPANLIFVLGLVAWVVCLVLMIGSLGPALRFDKNPMLKTQFAGLSSEHSRQDLLAHGATPFLAVYALGGFAAEQVGAVQQSALLWLGADFLGLQPVRFEQWPTYLGILVAAWILLRLIGLLHARRPGTLTGIGQVIAKGTVVLSAFIVVTEFMRRAGDWITTRVVWDWVEAARRGFLDVLPDWHLPLIELALPAALDQFVFTVIPGILGAALLPLTWLALTACVFGWRDLTSNPLGTTETEQALLARGDRVAASRIGQRVRGAFAAGPLRLAWRQVQGKAPVRDIPIAIQDRSFDADGSLFYPDARAIFDEYAGPFVPESPVPPAWNPEFFGNTLIANGRTWPFLDVEQRRYRLRLLNGCNSRFLILDFSGIPGVKVALVGNDGGFLPEVHDVMADGGRLLLGTAERADVIVDFHEVPHGNHVLGNVGPDEPYGGGEPGTDFEVAAAGTTGRVLQFRVGPRRGADGSTPIEFLRLPARAALPAEVRTRRVALLEHEHGTGDEGAPTAALLGTLDEGDGRIVAVARTWMDAVTETPAAGDTEVWEIFNFTPDAHTVHVHEVLFEVVGRQDFTLVDDRLEMSAEHPVHPGERGRKDTVIAYPGQVTRIRARFSTAGQYVWHCHVLEHEDNEMMRPYRIGPVQPGQPGA